MEREVWERDDEASNYEISNKGRVRNTKTKRLVKPIVDQRGDKVVRLYMNGKRITRKIGRLVAKHYINPSIETNYVKHRDGDRSNTEVDNLYIESRYSGKRIRVVETGEIFNSLDECSEHIGISKSYISKCVNYPFYNNRKGYHFEIID